MRLWLSIGEAPHHSAGIRLIPPECPTKPTELFSCGRTSAANVGDPETARHSLSRRLIVASQHYDVNAFGGERSQRAGRRGLYWISDTDNARPLPSIAT